MGLYQRPDSDVYWISYLDANGQRVRESARTRDKDTAQRILDDKKGKVARGDELLPRVDRIRYDEAAESLVAYYETRRARTVVETKVRLLNLNAFFKGRTLPSITEDLIEAYAKHRLDEDGGPATINRELATLSKMLRLAYERRKLARLPKIERLQEPPPRAGFVTREQFDCIARHLPEDLQAATLIAFTYGWRLREFLSLRKDQLDLKAGAHGTLRLDPGTTKNGEGRVVHITQELRVALEAQLTRVRGLERRLGRIVPQLFPHLSGKLAGQQRDNLRKVWLSATKKAGLPGILIHDLRRSAVRNLEAAGVSRSVAMKITGHATESVYRRYAIVSDTDLAHATERISIRHVSRHVQGAL